MKSGAVRKLLSTTQPRVSPPGASIGDDTAYAALKELGSNQGPIGCWRICNALQGVGIITSEATAGRLLRGLDLQGLTRVIGSRGRILTPKGRRHLAALERSRRQRSCHNDLLRAVRAETIGDVCELLIVRRAVEAEAASLAALRATKREIRQIEHAVQRHTEEVRRRGVSIESNRAIHGLIAKASRSRVLEALINILLQEEYLHEIQTRIQRAADGLVPEDHLIVFQAIKSRQPDKAAKAMRAHMDRLLRVVQSYSAKRKSARRRRRGTRTHA